MTTGQVIGIVTAGSQKFVIEATEHRDGTKVGQLVDVRCNGELIHAYYAASLEDGFCDALDLIRDELRDLPAGKVWGLLELVAS